MTRLLIVEDDESLRTLYEAEFREDGFEVAAVGTGQAALEKIRELRPAVLILDVCLPDRSGLEILRQGLEEWPGMAVVINTAFAGYRESFACWLADAYVIKSSDLEELKAAVADAADAHLQAA
jgi:two-component system response regulator (stage 0 sporulation protein F)